MLSIAECVGQLQKFSESPKVAEIINLLTLLELAELADEAVEKLRKKLLKTIANKVNAQLKKDGVSLVDAAFAATLAVAHIKPINENDPISLGPIEPENQIVVSTGEQFDIVNLIQFHNRRNPDYKRNELSHSKWLFNPLSMKPLSIRDVNHIRDAAAKMNMVILNLKTYSEMVTQTDRHIENPQPSLDLQIDMWRSLAQMAIGEVGASTAPSSNLSSSLSYGTLYGLLFYDTPSFSDSRSDNSLSLNPRILILTWLNMLLRGYEPVDGRPDNFMLNDGGRLFNIDNDRPLVSNVSHEAPQLITLPRWLKRTNSYSYEGAEQVRIVYWNTLPTHVLAIILTVQRDIYSIELIAGHSMSGFADTQEDIRRHNRMLSRALWLNGITTSSEHVLQFPNGFLANKNTFEMAGTNYDILRVIGNIFDTIRDLEGEDALDEEIKMAIYTLLQPNIPAIEGRVAMNNAI